MLSNRFQCGRQGNVEHRGALSNLVGGGGPSEFRIQLTIASILQRRLYVRTVVLVARPELAATAV